MTTETATPLVDARADDSSVWLARRAGVPAVWARYTDLIVDRGEGSWVVTEDGDRYLDYTCGIGVTNTGHAHPRVAAAIAEQAAKIIHAQQNILYHKPGLELHERLPRYFPNAGPDDDIGLFLSNSGAEAIEAAVKLAKVATHRPSIIAFKGGFHGRTHGTMSLTSSAIKNRGHYEPLLPSVYFAPFPYALRCPTGRTDADALAWTLAQLDELFATLVFPEDVAAFLVEPVLGEGGYVVPPDGFLPALRELADRHGILLIVDEVQSGYGRTGRFFATEWSGARPDIVVMAKGIASGMPLSGILASRELLGRWAPGGHGGTYGGNAVSCAAAVATLDVFEAEQLTARAETLGTRLLNGLREAVAGNPHVAEVRGRGLMVGIEFADPETLAPRPDLAKATMTDALIHRLLLLSCGTWGQVVRVIPPLVTSEAEIDQAVGIIGSAIQTAGESAV
ncbi:MAG TPA: aminotransferase class III-fold pyridoxal phosphate-dependent enzyme [Candidatus Limnocylindria bacterium]|jgi:4-aminobutyrate aminotransferase